MDITPRDFKSLASAYSAISTCIIKLRLFSWLVKVAILICDFLLISNRINHDISFKTCLFIIKTKSRSMLLSNDEGVNQFSFIVCFKVRTSRHHIDSIDTRIRTQDLLHVYQWLQALYQLSYVNIIYTIPMGLEPMLFAVTGRCFNQLNYGTISCF